MIEFTDDQREQVDSGKPIDVTDSETAKHYVVLRKDVYERLQHLLYDASDWTDEELQGILASSYEANGWDHPGMDVYDRYDEELRKKCP